MNKYEQIVEFLTNGETDKARSLFHDITVETSRKIYESLISDEDFADVSNDKTGDIIDDITDEVENEEITDSAKTLGKVITAEEAKQLLDYVDGSINEGDHGELLSKVASFYGVAQESVKGSLEENSDQLLDIAYGKVAEDDDEMPMGDDPEAMGDDPMADPEAMDDDPMADPEAMGDEVPAEGAIEDRVLDLEDALDELKSEFDAIMSDEMGDDPMADPEAMDDDPMADPEAMDDDPEAMDDDPEAMGVDPMADPIESRRSTPTSASDLMREYIEKVNAPENTEGKGVAAGGAGANVNKSSVVAGKNDMGGTAKNLVKGGTNSNPDGTTPPSTDKPANLKHAGSFQNVAGGRVRQGSAKSPVTSEPSGVNKRSTL